MSIIGITDFSLINEEEIIELASNWRGRRVELRKKFETLTNEEEKIFYTRILVQQVAWMIDHPEPVFGFLWKAEREKHTWYLFGEAHQRLMNWESPTSLCRKEDITYLHTIFHATVLQKLDISEKLFLEVDVGNTESLQKIADWKKDQSWKVEENRRHESFWKPAFLEKKFYH